MAEGNPILLDGYDKLFENRVRLGVMSVLAANDSYDFVSLRQMLGVTDGNLTTHLKALETAGFISSIKQFIGRKPNTSYSITEQGRSAFAAHIGALSKLLKV
ncbi:MAG: transcriptional regulator [Bacteroidaceae bacterium]|nr:transcriptional regulator [Bacteroidaceae bacterium]